MKCKGEQLKACKSYIKNNYGDIPTYIIAEKLGVSVYHVRKIARSMGMNISEEQLGNFAAKNRGKNPNPITYTTCMLVCKYHFGGDSINMISHLLMRPPSVIKRILEKSKENGFYDKINRR